MCTYTCYYRCRERLSEEDCALPADMPIRTLTSSGSIKRTGSASSSSRMFKGSAREPRLKWIAEARQSKRDSIDLSSRLAKRSYAIRTPHLDKWVSALVRAVWRGLARGRFRS